jgi:ribosome-binding ATPase YchF (GTP1/OBG family)
MKDLFLLSSKPVIYTANISEKDMGKAESELPLVQKVIEFAKTENSEYMVICAKIEEELSMLEGEEQELFLAEYGVETSGLDRLVEVSYRTLGLLSYLTAGEKEVRAWTIENGTKAPQAAGKIHTDFEKGFIRAEIVDYDILVELGSFNAAKEKGKVRSEGKEYVIKDGDVVLFRFNV